MSETPDLPLKHFPAFRPGTPAKTNDDSNNPSADDACRLPDSVTEAEASSGNHGSVLSDNNRNVEVAAGSSDNATKQKVYHTGWRLHALTSALCLSLLLSTLETTIVSTALVSIVDALEGFNMAGWIVTSFLVTYTGFLIIYSKLSDIFGCKLMLLLAITIFTVFSMACGASDSMVPLIVFRAFQGMGGSGIYSLSTIMVPLMVPPDKYATYISIMSSTFILSSVLGPILGGAITDHTTWRWVFYFNGPGGALAAVLLAFSVPFNFPYGESDQFFHSLASKQMWKRVDFVGMAVSLAASILIIFALEQGGVAYPWGSGAIVSTFVLSGVFWIALLGSDCCLVETVFVMGLLLNGFFTGFPFMAALINIPQRFQTVNTTSAINAGIRTLPLLLLSPLATAINGILVSKLGVPPLYTLFLGGSLQTIGVGLYSSLKSSTSIASAQYGYEAIMGLGFGFNLSTILMMVPLVVTEKDLAVTMGSVTQIRVLGGTIGLAVCSALLINHIKREAVKFLTAEQVAQILLSSENIGMLSPEIQSRIRVLYADAYSEQMRVMLYFSIASILSLVLLVERQPRRAPSKPERAG
ncbi:major facilitator superfamily transporter [Fusarium globosum]|uniref:Major facilitator superfamily transporter n=1 Tax=Fusarium globosum TaxID=78864 RepID=A0A8H5XUH5_9HYPO|nr:major facilitator superfamily transporter [Fusarium globosum]